MKVKDIVCGSLYEDLVCAAQIPMLKKEKKRTFLITGGNGFIMYYLVLTLLCLNDEYHNGNIITLMVRNEKKAIKKYGGLMQRDDLRLLVQDVCTPVGTDEGFDYIIHAASAASAQQFDEDPIGVFNANVQGTENLISLVRERGCRSMVYVSSFTVYGNGTQDTDSIDESFRSTEDWNSNRAAYSLGKRSAEFLCGAAWRKYGCPIRIVRPGFVYGGSAPDDNRVYSEIIRNVAEGKPITLQSAGYIFRSVVYVTDVVRGILFCLFNGENGEAYNIANEFVSIRKFAETAAQNAVSSNVVLKFKNEEDRMTTSVANPGGAMVIQKMMARGWKPEVSLAKGIAMSAEIYAYHYLRKIDVY